MGALFGRGQRRRVRLPIVFFSVLCLLLGMLGLLPGASMLLVGALAPPTASAETLHAPGDRVLVARARGVVNPVMASYLDRAIAQAEREQAAALVFALDTPGGLDTSMRQMVQSIVNSPVPVIVYVSPPGGRAASAGLFVTMAGHVAAMAPNTNIGSAHPVMLGPGGEQPQQSDPTMTEKVTNDAVALVRSLAERRGRNVEWVEEAVRESANLPANEAREANVVDVVAEDIPALLNQTDGREVTLPNGTHTLRTAGLPIVEVPPTFAEQVLQALSDPNLAYILLTLGTYGLIYELANPGAIFPGVVGVICLILAFYALGTLPVNYAGVALILFAFALLLADVVFTPGVGVLAGGGIAALIVGSLLLFSTPTPSVELSPWVVAGVVLATAGFFFVAIRGVRRAQYRPVSTGREALLGQVAITQTELKPRGMVHVAGELWEAVASDGPIPQGSPVRIEQVEGLTLVVRAVRRAPITARQ